VSSRRTAMMAEPNITPLIDVLLVLLIIFMLVVPSVTRGVDASLPAPASGAGKDDEALVVEVDASGLRLNRAAFASADELEGRLREVLATRTDKTVLVKPGRPLLYGEVVHVIDLARAAGAERVGLVPSTIDGCGTAPCAGASRPSPAGTGS
jgi:biopolymer transport protein TolR